MTGISTATFRWIYSNAAGSNNTYKLMSSRLPGERHLMVNLPMPRPFDCLNCSASARWVTHQHAKRTRRQGANLVRAPTTSQPRQNFFRDLSIFLACCSNGILNPQVRCTCGLREPPAAYSLPRTAVIRPTRRPPFK